MLSIKAISSSSGAAHYYSEADYYTEKGDKDIASLWQGQGAEKLGLSGNVDPAIFKKLLEGKISDVVSLGRTGPDGDVKHQMGWDFTLSAPKSVSVLALAGGDKRLVEAHHEAVISALKHLEKNYSSTRQSVNGEIKDVLTGNLVTASFTHSTSRDMDPQLHTHNVIMNITQRPDGEWRSVESRRMYNVSTKIGQIYRNELALNVKKIGYQLDVDQKKGTFDIKGVPQNVLDGFSKRRAAILEAADKYGYRTAKGMDNAAVRTRSGKKQSDRSSLKSLWSEQLKDMNYETIGVIKSAVGDVSMKMPSTETAQSVNTSLDFAIEHLSEREAVFTRDDLHQQTLRVGLGKINIDAVEQGITEAVANNRLVDAVIGEGRDQEPAFTTPASINKENYVISLVKRGMKDVPRIASRRQIINLLDGKGFTPGQAKTVKHILSSKDRVIGVQGDAGTGKTYMLTSVREMAEANGYKLTGLSPSGTAATLLQEETGINSRTIASYITKMNNTRKLEQNDKEILVVDEASLKKTQDTADLLTISRKTRSRIVLVGDRKQLGAVEAGKPFELLLDAGMAHTLMTDNLRQKDSPDLLDAVKNAIDNNPTSALQSISENVNEISDSDERINAIVQKVLSMDEREHKETLVLIPDNETREQVNAEIRAGLQAKGIVSDKDMKVVGLTNKGNTRAEKGRIEFYEKGDVVVFGRDFKSINALAERPYDVIDKDMNRGFLTLKDQMGKTVEWEPSKVAGNAKNGVELYEIKKDRKIAAGDEIRWRRKDKVLGLMNTETGKVQSINMKTGIASILFKKGGLKDIDLNANRHWEHNYATTVYSGQGATYSQAIINAESWRRNLINQKSFYVALSRAKFKSHIYTDDKAKLASGIFTRTGDKTSSLHGTKVSYQNMLSSRESTKTLEHVTNKPKEAIKNAARALLRIKPERNFDLER